MILIILIT